MNQKILTDKLKEIHDLEAQLEELREQARLAIHTDITGEETWWEVYSNLKQAVLTEEEFNDRASRLRETWLKKKYGV